MTSYMFSRNVPSIICTQRPPTCAETIAPFCFTTRVNSRLGRLMSTPCPIRNFNSPSRSLVEVREQGRGGDGGAAGGGVFGQAARARMKHPRLQVAGLGRRHLARVEIDRVGADARQGFGERGGIGLCPPQRIARGDFHRQERQSDRDDLRWMPAGYDIG